MHGNVRLRMFRAESVLRAIWFHCSDLAARPVRPIPSSKGGLPHAPHDCEVKMPAAEEVPLHPCRIGAISARIPSAVDTSPFIGKSF